MRKYLLLLAALGLLFSSHTPVLWAQEERSHEAGEEQSQDVQEEPLQEQQLQEQQLSSSSHFDTLNAIMRPDRATRDRWYQEYLNAPKSYIDREIGRRLTLGASNPFPLLLDHITYTPSERNQGGCGNCWVWAGTALMETKHSVETGVKDRLSIQWFDSAFYTFPDGGKYACVGGNLGELLKFYNKRVFVPWSNTNAHFQDGSGGVAPHVAASSISTDPYYNGSVDSFQAATVPTTDVTQATAIANIKNVLNQNKAVQFNFWLPRDANWTSFRSFWNNQAESTTWNPDTFCGLTEDAGVGGHAVTIVGYDDSDASTANRYWIVLNSWGAPAGRPNGLFRMRMYMNYKCTEKSADGTKTYWNRQFQNIETVAGKTPFINYNRLFMASRGASTASIWFREKAVGGPWSIWSMLDGTTSTAPALVTFNTRQYMVRKGATDTTIWIRSTNSSGLWSSWAPVLGSTDAAPALAVYRNKLYLFVKGAGVQTISYKYMNTSGTWSAWSTVPSIASNHAPAVAVNNDRLELFHTGTDNRIYVKSMASNGSWSGNGVLDWSDDHMRSNAAPAATVFDNRTHVVVKGSPTAATATGIYSTAHATNGGWYYWGLIPGAGATNQAPRVGTGPDIKTFNVAVIGTSNNTIWSQTYVKGTGWNPSWTRVPGYSTAAPSLNTYWFASEPYPTMTPSSEVAPFNEADELLTSTE